MHETKRARQLVTALEEELETLQRKLEVYESGEELEALRQSLEDRDNRIEELEHEITELEEGPPEPFRIEYMQSPISVAAYRHMPLPRLLEMLAQMLEYSADPDDLPPIDPDLAIVLRERAESML